MQYILSEEELKELQSRPIKNENTLSRKLQQVCTLAAEKIPQKYDWDPNGEPIPWGCILSEEDELNSGYCDDCPVKEFCPYQFKRWSK